MPLSFHTCKRLWDKIAVSLVYVANSYEPAWYDNAPGLRHDAHLIYTRMLLEPIILAYAAIDSCKVVRDA